MLRRIGLDLFRSSWRYVGSSEACGGDRRVEFTCYLDRGYPLCDTKFGW